MKYKVTAHLYRTKRHVPRKRRSELWYWQEQVDAYVRWLGGDSSGLYGLPSPAPSEVITGRDVRETAILTFMQKTSDKYLKHLGVGSRFLVGKTVLEIGCGPLENAMCFDGCKVIGLDPLLSLYKQVGYPLRTHGGRMQYVCARAEEVPLRDHSVDAVISVNAIDHVEDFFAAAREIDRVMVPGGALRIETHYHPPTPLEPWSLDDKIVVQAFSGRRLLKVSDIPYTTSRTRAAPKWRGQPPERLVVWANAPVEG